MIKVDKESCEVVGRGSDVLAEVSMLINRLRQNFEDDDIKKAVKIGFMSPEELDAEIESKLEKLLEALRDKR